jgi:hypothetical protein
MGSVASPPNIAERDPDDMLDGEGIFDDDGDIFDDDGDFDTDDEGIFADKTSIFSTPQTPSEDHRNPITTRSQEIARYERPVEELAPVRARAQLVAKFDANGLPWVCRHLNGKPIEKFRKPTREEFEKLKAQGRIVKGGIGQVPAKGEAGAPPPNKFSRILKLLLLTGVVGAGGYAAYRIYRNRKIEEEAEIDVAEA